MKTYLVISFFLSIFVILEVQGSFHDEVIHDSAHEVVYRVPRGVREKSRAGECRYKKGPWSDCDVPSNMQRKTLNLKRGDSACEQTKVITRKCKKACKYEKGEWSECEAATNTRTRTDTLKPKSDTSCQPTRTISKKCKKTCKYNTRALWSECDVTTGKKTKILTLKSGNSQTCEPSKKITKLCNKSGHGSHKGNKGRLVDDGDDYGDEDE